MNSRWCRQQALASLGFGAALGLFLSTSAEADQSLVFLGKWGSRGSASGQFESPSGVAVGPNGNVYVADRDNHRIQMFTSSGAFVSAWGDSGSGDGQFGKPRDVAVDANGEVYVVDYLNSRIQVFTSTGGYLRQWGSDGVGNGQFKSARGVAVDDSFHVFVSDIGFTTRVQKFTSTGTYLGQWNSGDGPLTSPRGMCIDASGFVYVVDTTGNRVQKFTSMGVFDSGWGTPGSGSGQFALPVGIAYADGRTVVADQNNHRIQVFTLSGAFLESCGSLCSISGGTGCVDPDGAGPLQTGDGQFNFPTAVTADADGNIYVPDSQNHRIQKFGRPRTSGTGPVAAALSGMIAAPNPTRSAVSVMFNVNTTDLANDAGARVLARVYDGSGRLIRRLFEGPLPAGAHSLTWEGAGRTGDSVPPGVYFVVFQVEGLPAQSVKVVRLP